MANTLTANSQYMPSPYYGGVPYNGVPYNGVPTRGRAAIQPFDPSVLSSMQGFVSAVANRQQLFNQAYSMPISEISRIGSLETADKPELNARLGEFIDKVNSVVDKYNGDYSAAAQELAQVIGLERANPFYAYNQQKVNAVKLEQQTRAQLGANYLSALNPSEVTYEQWKENPELFSKYTPVNRQDIVKTAMTAFAPIAKAISEKDPAILTRLQGDPEGQYFLAQIQNGFKNPQEVVDFLTKNKVGRQIVSDIMEKIPAIADLPSGQVMSAITEGAMSAIGPTKTQIVPDQGYKSRAVGDTNTSFGIGVVSSEGVNEPGSILSKVNNSRQLRKLSKQNEIVGMFRDQMEDVLFKTNPEFAQKYAAAMDNFANTFFASGLSKDLEDMIDREGSIVVNIGTGKPIEITKDKYDELVSDPLGSIDGEHDNKNILWNMINNNVIKGYRAGKIQFGLDNSYKNKAAEYFKPLDDIEKDYDKLMDNTLSNYGGDFSMQFYNIDLSKVPTDQLPDAERVIKAVKTMFDNSAPEDIEFLGYPGYNRGFKKLVSPKDRKKFNSDVFKTIKEKGFTLVGVGSNTFGPMFKVKDSKGDTYIIRFKNSELNESAASLISPKIALAAKFNQSYNTLAAAYKTISDNGTDLSKMTSTKFLQTVFPFDGTPESIQRLAGIISTFSKYNVIQDPNDLVNMSAKDLMGRITAFRENPSFFNPQINQ